MVKKWWSRLEEGRAPNVIVLQFDLGGHTRAAGQMATDVEAFQQFKDFGLRLEKALGPHGFACLHWLGDGGLFAKEHKGMGDADNICAAADEAFRIFQEIWGTSGYGLTLRATATLLHRVYIAQESGYWYSLGLNHFLKHERRIGTPGAFAITGPLKRSLTTNSDALSRFTKTEPRPVSIEEGDSFQVFIDSRHPARVEEDPGRFEVWLARRTWPPSSRQVKGQSHGQIVGDSLLLGSALTTAGYDSISLVQVAPLKETEGYVEKYRNEYDDCLQKIASLKGKKASVTGYWPPLTDDPALRLEWQLIDYPRVRAFHQLMESNSEAWAHYYAPSLATDPRWAPSILVSHNVIILGAKSGKPHLVLAHRKWGARTGGYYNNQWSVSFEEQFSPVRSRRDSRDFPADSDLQSTVFRGVREEFLGESFDGRCTAQIHAVQIELLNFNFSVLGAVLLPEMTFKELTDRWHAPDAVDRHEHDALVAIPCEKDTLSKCLESPGLPAELWDTALKSGRDDLQGTDHLWHPTSKARLAMSLWLLESGVI